MNLDEAIAVFDKSAERTRPNKQTEAWAVIRAAIALMRGQSWQPIETAPKDLGSFLVWCPDRKNTYMVTANAGHGFRVFGGYELCEEATHWQPRPDPPKEPAE